MRRVLVKNIYPYFFAIFPLLSLYDTNKDMAQFSYLIVPFFLCLIATAALLTITRHFLQNKQKSFLIVSFFMLTFLSFGHFFELIYTLFSTYFPRYSSSQQYYLAFYYFSLVLWFSAVGIFTWCIIRSKEHLDVISTFAAYIAFFLVIIPLASIGVDYFKTHSIPIGYDISSRSLEISDKHPDIYYIIFDGYGRNDVLQKYYDFDNSVFTKSLEDKGFFIANKGRSNYPQTYSSMASSLNYDYLDSFFPDIDPFSDNRWLLRDLIRNNAAYDFLGSKGYSFVVLPSIWSGTNHNLYGDHVFGSTLDSNEFSQLLVRLTPFGASFGQRIRYNQQRRIVNQVFTQLPDIATIKDSTFTYVHILIPHPPFIFDENGNPADSLGKTIDFHGLHYSRTPQRVEQYREEYIKQLQYANKRISLAIDKIINRSTSQPVIILQSDHGPGSMLDWEDPDKTNMHERMSILNAYYLPDKGKEMLYDSITPVNTFRVVFNTLFDADLELLEDKNYFATWNHPYDFTDVTELFPN